LREHCAMLAFANVRNKSKIVAKVPLSKLIEENFNAETKKFFFSLEVSPKENLMLDFYGFKVLPLFVNITWIRDDNLTAPLRDAPAFKLAEQIKSSHVVNSVTCYKLTDEDLNEILSNPETTENFNLLRGGASWSVFC